MKNQFSFLSSILLITTMLFGCAEKQNVLTQQESQDGWQLLFDGQTLNGWKNYNAPGISGWTVENGCLAANGTGADMNGYKIGRASCRERV